MTETQDRSAHVWTDEKAAFESLVALDDSSLFIASPEESRIAEIAKQIRSGTSPIAALKDAKPRQIQLDSLKYIKSNRHSTIVNYKISGTDGKDKLGNFTFKQEQRDDLFKKLEILCSRGFTYTETQFNRLRAALSPFITICIVALFTFVCRNAAIEMAEGRSVEIRGRYALMKRLFVWALDVLGSIGVVIVGSIIGVLCLVWMVKRIATPPLMLEYRKAN
jgi:hypothetical protein